MASRDPHIANDYIDEIRVGTVFLGMDHNSGTNGPPLLFETIIVGGALDQFRMRCTTYEQAELTHQIVLSMARREQENKNRAMEIARNVISSIRAERKDNQA